MQLVSHAEDQYENQTNARRAPEETYSLRRSSRAGRTGWEWLENIRTLFQPVSFLSQTLATTCRYASLGFLTAWLSIECLKYLKTLVSKQTFMNMNFFKMFNFVFTNCLNIYFLRLSWRQWAASESWCHGSWWGTWRCTPSRSWWEWCSVVTRGDCVLKRHFVFVQYDIVYNLMSKRFFNVTIMQ